MYFSTSSPPRDTTTPATLPSSTVAVSCFHLLKSPAGVATCASITFDGWIVLGLAARGNCSEVPVLGGVNADKGSVGRTLWPFLRAPTPGEWGSGGRTWLLMLPAGRLNAAKVIEYWVYNYLEIASDGRWALVVRWVARWWKRLGEGGNRMVDSRCAWNAGSGSEYKAILPGQPRAKVLWEDARAIYWSLCFFHQQRRTWNPMSIDVATIPSHTVLVSSNNPHGEVSTVARCLA